MVYHEINSYESSLDKLAMTKRSLHIVSYFTINQKELIILHYMFSKYPGVELALSVECQQNLQPFYTATEHAFQGISPVITAFSQIFLVSLAQR